MELVCVCALRGCDRGWGAPTGRGGPDQSSSFSMAMAMAFRLEHANAVFCSNVFWCDFLQHRQCCKRRRRTAVVFLRDALTTAAFLHTIFITIFLQRSICCKSSFTTPPVAKKEVKKGNIFKQQDLRYKSILQHNPCCKMFLQKAFVAKLLHVARPLDWPYLTAREAGDLSERLAGPTRSMVHIIS